MEKSLTKKNIKLDKLLDKLLVKLLRKSLFCHKNIYLK